MLPPVLKLVKSIPFARLVTALIAGILVQWYAKPGLIPANSAFLISLLLWILFLFMPLHTRYRFRWLNGMLLLLTVAATGAILCWQKDIRHHPLWAGKLINDSSILIVTLQEPPVIKPKSYKAIAAINAIRINNRWQSTTGNLLIYLKKDSTSAKLEYGSQIILHRKLQAITNSGNPGAFDYQRYCLFQDINYQAYLQEKDYLPLAGNNGNTFQRYLFYIRDGVIRILRQSIPGNKEQGVAEALLIGYRNDLDKELVQAYSNTGVVHIIAISGMHLGMIYGLLYWLLEKFRQKKILRILRPLIMLAVLWLFTLLAGAAPSILRSAVMFSFIILGEALNRKSSIYNTLAASAFCLLAWNPFMLWDVGFQLSYAAVLSIVIFMRPIYYLIYIKNKALDKLWEMTAITMAAQLLTLPFVVYTFHQFPLLFFITNLAAVPLSTIILYGELLLILLNFIKVVAAIIGKILYGLLWCMNSVIEHTNRLSFAVWNGLQLSTPQAVLLFLIIAAVGAYLFHKKKSLLFTALACSLLFFVIRSADFISRQQQHKLIVYNVPQCTAIDILDGRNAFFAGDSLLIQDQFLQNFHLKPSRIMHRLMMNYQFIQADHFIVNGKNVMRIHNKPSLASLHQDSTVIDVLILSGNPKVYISQLYQSIRFRQLVFDSSNPLWKIEKWKKDCERLHLRFHSVPGQGAFVMDL